jgi:hypothetical protein
MLELTPNQIRQSYGLDIDCKKEGLSEYYLAFFKKLTLKTKMAS